MKYRDENGDFQDLYFKTGDTLPIGTIVSYGSLTAPTNWLVCDGSAVSRTTYAALFAAIGTSYGSGDGSTTFNLPDLRGRVPVGKSTDTEFDTLGETGGEKTHTLTINEMPSHNHAVSLEGSDISDQGAAWTGWTQPPTRRNYAGIDLAQYTGGGQAHNNLQPYQVVCFIIKAEDAAGVVANVTNIQNDSTKDTYSCDYINRKYIKVTTNQKQIPDTTRYLNIAFNNTAFNVGNAFSRTNNQVKVTGDNVHHVKVSCTLWIESGVTEESYVWCYIQKKSDENITTVAEFMRPPVTVSSQPWGSVSFDTIIEVTKDDIIYPRVLYLTESVENCVNGTYHDACYMTVEALD